MSGWVPVGDHTDLSFRGGRLTATNAAGQRTFTSINPNEQHAPGSNIGVRPKGYQPPGQNLNQAYDDNVAQSMQYLTNQERQVAMQRQAELSKVRDSAKQQFAQLNNMSQLATQGAAGVRAQQALLRAKGYNIAPDGVNGPATQKAWNDYSSKTTGNLNAFVKAKSTWAHPILGVRAESNAAITPQKTAAQTAGILGHITEEERNTRAALAVAKSNDRKGLSAGPGNDITTLSENLAGLERFKQSVMDPNTMDATQIDNAFRQIQTMNILSDRQGAQAEAKIARGPGLLDIFKGMAAYGLTTGFKSVTGLDLDRITNLGEAGLAAAQTTSLHSGGWSGLYKGAQALLGGYLNFNVPFTSINISHVVAPGGSDARKWIDLTATSAKREALVESGDLLSEGQLATGRYTPQFIAAHGQAPISIIRLGEDPRKIAAEGISPHKDLFSGLVDIAFIPAKDPTFLATEGLGELKNIGEVAARRAVANATPDMLEQFGKPVIEKFGRLSYLDGMTGRTLQNSIYDTMLDSVKTGSVDALRKSIPGLHVNVADEAVAALKAAPSVEEGAVAATRVVTNAFRDGIWSPQISAFSQLTNAVGGRLGFISGEAGDTFVGLSKAGEIGGQAVKSGRLSSWFRAWATPKSELAQAMESHAVEFVDESVDVAARAGGRTANDIWTKVVSHQVAGMTLEERFYHLVDSVYKLDNPALHAAFEGNLVKFFSDPGLLKSVPLVSYLDAAFSQSGLEEALRKMEVVSEIMHGGAGEAAQRQMEADLARGFHLTQGQINGAVGQAARNIGLGVDPLKPGNLGRPLADATRENLAKQIASLPTELRTHFEDRLRAIAETGKNAKKGLGKLGRDLEWTTKSKALRDELARVLEQQQGRGTLAAESAGGVSKAGLGRGAKATIGKFVTSNMDVIPPSELKFTYDSQNELEHIRLRGANMRDYTNALHLPAHIQENFVDQFAHAATEEEAMNIVRRVTETAAENLGVTNVPHVMQILEDADRFKQAALEKSRPIRDVNGDGTPDENLQMLSQRIDSVKLTKPEDLMHAVRQAILDGTQDANTARRIAARIRVALHDTGEISLHYVQSSGKELVLKDLPHGFHRFWKFIVVTNMGLPIIAASAAFIGTQGKLMDKMRASGLGFAAAGMFGGVRYIGRVVLLEGRFRMLMSEGFNPDTIIPGWGRLKAHFYSDADPLRRTLGDDLVRQGNYGTNHMENDLLAHVDPDWVVLDRAHARTPDAWWRTANHTIHPESDEVTAIILREHAGHFDGMTEEVQRVVKVEEKKAAPEFAAKGSESRTPPNAAAGLNVEANGSEVPRLTNDQLLSEHPDAAATQTFWRGEPGEFDTRGNWWVPSDYEGGRGEEYARRLAGEDGKVYKVDLPVDAEGKPLVGMAPETPEGNIGHYLAGPDQKWADSAVEAVPNGIAPEAAEQYKLVTTTRTISARKHADKLIKDFLDTEEGAMWKERWKGAIGGTKSPKEAVERMRAFIEKYMTPEMAGQRVAGGLEGRPGVISRDTFVRALKDGKGPDYFGTQKIWKMPRGPRDLVRAARENVARGVLTGPDNVLNRGPMKNYVFQREYDRLVANGVDRELSQKMADSWANERVNDILHRFDRPSRFAAKVDMFMPFQHMREDVLRVWGKLAIENPMRVFRVAETVAKGFNNGEKAGIFTQNAFTHEWEITIPGRLSRTLFKLPFDLPFSVNIRDVLFIGNGAYSLAPTLGGPYWSVIARELANWKPELYQGSYPLHDWLWGYGPSGHILNSNASRLWMAYTGDTPPWEKASRDGWQNDHNRWQVEIAQELAYQHRLKGGDQGWLPSKQEVDDATRKFYEAWVFFGSTVPASSYPQLTTKSKFEMAVNAFTDGGAVPLNEEAFLQHHPEFEAYLAGGVSKYTGPDDLATLKRLRVGNAPDSLSKYNTETGQWDSLTPWADENTAMENKLGYKQYADFSEWKAHFKTYERTGMYFRMLKAARAVPDFITREQMISDVNKEYADIVQTQNHDYQIKQELYNIGWQVPKQLQDQAIARVRANYGLSNLALMGYQRAVNKSGFHLDAWQGSRLGVELDAVVRKQLGKQDTGGAVERLVATFSPAEQANYWEYQYKALGYNEAGWTDQYGNQQKLGDAHTLLDQYNYFKKMHADVTNSNPWLYPAKSDYVNPFTEKMKGVQADLDTQTTATYASISQVQSEMDAAAGAKQWKSYYALKKQRDNLYALADSIHNKLLNDTPDLTKYYEDLHAAGMYEDRGNHDMADLLRKQALMDKAHAPMWLIPEQRRYAAMPDAVKGAYLKDLIDQLNMPTGRLPRDVTKYIKETTGLKKMFWSYLTPNQQELMSQNFPQYVQKWKYESDQIAAKGSGSGFHKKSRPSDLQWAYSQLDAFSRRAGMKKPAALQQYLDLPNVFSMRQSFLEQHPEVSEWLNNGPFKFMPPQLRDSVSGVLAKYGKFHGIKLGDGGSFKQSIDLEWAKYQLSFYNRRTGTAPTTYDLWLNMPSGQDKAKYLQQHPEIGDWLRQGPMSSMPEVYKEVVRDIMTRYGEWTERADPLGKTVSQFFATPGYARQDFLAQHPELEAYWATTRTPQENAMFDLQNQYFQIQDVNAKRAFLSAHPDLQQHMLDARSARYEKFLNQVAVYMGANPEMFRDYLTRQTDILAELLRRFAEPHVIRERTPATVSAETGQGDTGRARRHSARSAA